MNIKSKKNLRILFSGKALSLQKYGGVSRYFCEIIKRLDTYNDINVKVAAKLFDNVYFQEFYTKNKIKYYRLHGKLGKMINIIHFVLMSVIYRPNVIHSTYYDIFPDFLFKNILHVTTVHDMAYERGLLPNIGNVIEKKKYHIYKADIIIAVSEWTKKEILDIYPDINAEKIKVIYHGNSLLPKESKRILGILEKKYILFVGQRSNYKNFFTLLKAFSIIANMTNDVELICSGKSFNEEEIATIYKLGITGKVYQEEFNDDDLCDAYKNAICFIYPSLYEGFGIPILEAWSCGCPILLSDIPVFREVAEDGALYFSPHDEVELSQMIMDMINNENLRKQLVSRGTELVKKYDWTIAAKKTADLYRKLLN